MEKSTSSSLSNIENDRTFDSILNLTTNRVRGLLENFVNISDVQTDLSSVFGSNLEIQQFSQSWKTGEFAFPEIEVVQSSQIGNANGAFAKETNKIYLSQELLTTNAGNIDTIASVFLEEYGHYVDSELNTIDTPGDEGALFASLIQNQELSDRELEQLMGEDDTATVILDGKKIEIEQSFTELVNG